MTIYATLDADQHYIRDNATIRAFDTEVAAREYLAAAYRDGLDDGETLTFEPGHFGDCWFKAHIATAPTIDELASWGKPFAADDLIVQAPGEHPGGRAYWITPSEDVLVAVVAPPKPQA